MKRCSKCKLIKPCSEFYKSTRAGPTGLRSDCKDCARAASARWAAINSERACQRSTRWNLANPNKRREITSRWYATNLKQTRAANAKWAQANPEKRAAHNAAYRSRKHNRIPLWLTPDDLAVIATIYKHAQQVTRETGIAHEVDHIIPLYGKRVSGLHVPENLRVIQKLDNARKGNRTLDL